MMVHSLSDYHLHLLCKSQFTISLLLPLWYSLFSCTLFYHWHHVLMKLLWWTPFSNFKCHLLWRVYWNSLKRDHTKDVIKFTIKLLFCESPRTNSTKLVRLLNWMDQTMKFATIIQKHYVCRDLRVILRCVHDFKKCFLWHNYQFFNKPAQEMF